MPTFVGKFKGPWRFCTFCSELGRPMGTKSHISKALPASIMTTGIGLIVLQRDTFRTGCVYLNFPGHFHYVSQHKSTADDKFLHGERRRGDSGALCYHILFYSPLFYMEALVCESSFHVWEKSICNGSVQALFSPDSMPKGSFLFSHVLRLFLPLSQNIGDRKSRSLASSLWAFASIFHMHYETPLIKFQVYAMTRPPSICNKCLFFPRFSHLPSVFRAFSGGCRLDESDFMPVSKPKVFYL